MAIARIAAAILALAAATWGHSEEPGKILDRANAEVTYMSFERALPLYQAVAQQSQVGSEPWQVATFGAAVCQQQMMPANPNTVSEAARLYQLLLEKAPSSRFAPRAMMNLGRLAELVDYSGDTSDREKAREWYAKALQAGKGTPIEAEAVLRTAATYIQTYQKDQISQGLKILHDYLAQNPNDALASAMWQYMGETYFYPLEDYRNSLDCYKKADALGLLEEGREGPVYWRMAIMADRYLKDRDTAIEYYKKIIIKTPTSGKAYEAQLALKALGVEPPKIELFDIVGSQDSGDAPVTAPAATQRGAK